MEQDLKTKMKRMINLLSVDDQGDFFTTDDASNELRELIATLEKDLRD